MPEIHWSLARLIDAARGVVDSTEQAKLEAHLSSCLRCREEAAWARALERTLGEGPLPDPPEASIRQAYGIFPKPRRLPAPGRMERLLHQVASLVRDSAAEPLPAGVRAGAPVPRQLLFESEGADVALKLFPGEKGAGKSLYGHVAPRNPAADPADLEIRLVPERAQNQRTKTDRFGEFVFEEIPDEGFAVAISFEGTVLTVGPVRPAEAI